MQPQADEQRGKRACAPTARGSISKAMKGLVGGAAAGSAECRKQWTTALLLRSSGQGTLPLSAWSGGRYKNSPQRCAGTREQQNRRLYTVRMAVVVEPFFFSKKKPKMKRNASKKKHRKMKRNAIFHPKQGKNEKMKKSKNFLKTFLRKTKTTWKKQNQKNEKNKKSIKKKNEKQIKKTK